MPFAATWMVLEFVILSEICHRKTSITQRCLYVESKSGTNEFIYKIEVGLQMLEISLRLPGGKVEEE